MEVRELRIGNLLKSANSERVFSVTIEDLVIIEAGSKCRPIQLTEEWLLKFGFIYNGWNYDFQSYVFHAQGKNDKGEFYNTEFGIRKNKEILNISFKIQYVHQLQNLYFALTGKELI